MTEMATLQPPATATASTTPASSRPGTPTQYLTHLPDRPPVDIEFVDLNYSVPVGRGSKLILRNVSGLFRSGHLTGILGPSGAGKSTLLNALAGYKCTGTTGSILTNGQPRDMRVFRKLSRYIMQEDLLQPRLTVLENMLISAHLKLGDSQTLHDKLLTIDEILKMLRLSGAKNTMTARLSGGERKRLSIALELVNNPPVIFLDEPTTGLDDLSSSQCIHLLKMLAEGGRTVICSVHTPSARLFAMFNHVYIVSHGMCVFQGQGSEIVPFLKSINLTCPTTYNPADFIIEVSSGEYGNHTEAMAAAVDNGKVVRWQRPGDDRLQPVSRTNPIQTHHGAYNFTSSGYSQFWILLKRMMLQQWRDRVYLTIKLLLHLACGLIVGTMFWQFGNDASKTLFNIGFCFVSLIAVLYIPLLPLLLAFPQEVQLLKREYFNRWYGLTSYFCAFSASLLPGHLIFTSIYIGIAYFMTNQPLDCYRFTVFAATILIVGCVSESLGMVLGSMFNIVNGIFMGPALCVPIMLLATYGLGYGRPIIPLPMKILMKMSYLRYGLEALLIAVYGGDRPPLICPDDVEHCEYRVPGNVLVIADVQDGTVWIDLLALFLQFFAYRLLSFFLLRWRLSHNSRIAAIQKVAQIVKSHFGLSRSH